MHGIIKNTSLYLVILILLLSGIVIYQHCTLNPIEEEKVEIDSSQEISKKDKELYVEISDVGIIPNCVRDLLEVKKHPCLAINLKVSNNAQHSLRFLLNKYSIVLKDGTQHGIYAGHFGMGGGLPKECYHPPPTELYAGEILYPDGKKSFKLCFPVVTKEENPKLYIGLLYNFDIETQEGLIKKIGGEEKEYNFDLVPFLENTSLLKPDYSSLTFHEAITFKAEYNDTTDVIKIIYEDLTNKTENITFRVYNNTGLYFEQTYYSSNITISLNDVPKNQFWYIAYTLNHNIYGNIKGSNT